jgi:general secretion pathway protein A
MYEAFFNLTTKPFELVPDPGFLFLSRAHKKAITYLDYGIREKKGFILITGEIGSGKTTIVRDMLKRLDDKITLSKVFNTKVSSEQLIALINEDFGLDVSGKDKIALLRQLNEFLVEEYANGRQPVLIIDEAQNLSHDLLEEVRLLSNLETDKSKLLQIILVGQPELRQTLALPELVQLRQRISVSCHIEHLTREETEAYIYHRLETAGNRSAVDFQEGTINFIYKFSCGIPRLINIACDFLMLSAFVDETKELTMELVKEVVGELATENRYWQDEGTKPPAMPKEADMQELISRLEGLEEGMSGKIPAGVGNEKTVERLSALEKLLSDSSSGFQSELSRLSDMVKALSAELSAVEEKNLEPTKSNSAVSETKEKGLWGRIFSW